MLTSLRNLLAAAFVATMASVATAQSGGPAPYQLVPSVNLWAGTTQWRVEESWGNDATLVYTFHANGDFESSTGATGHWAQTGQRVIIDWPSYSAIYVGRMQGDTISGVALSDTGETLGTFTLTRRH